MQLPHIEQQTKLCDLVMYWQANTPQARALVFHDQVLSYQDFWEHIEHCARMLLAQGVKQGDVVALYAQPSLVFAIHLFACARIGAVWLGLNPKYSPAELDYILNNAKPTCIWLEASCIAQAPAPVQAFFQQQTQVWRCATKTQKQQVQLHLSHYVSGTTAEETNVDLAKHILNTLQLPDLASLDSQLPAILIYTSGTTGNPKGAVISQYALTKASILQARLLQLNSPAILNNLPINHIGSVGDISTSMIANGGCIVMQEKFDIAEGFQLIEQHGVTLWGQIPTMFQLALEHESFAQANLSSLECILFSGAPASTELIQQLRAICPKVVNAYGMSETVGSICWAINESNHVLATTIGRPIASVEFRLATEEGVPVPFGEQGEIQIRSDYCFSYYWCDEQASREAFTDDGFLKTGDVGQENVDGTIMLVGRTKERFKSGGYNVYPREIEHALNEHPSVLDTVVVAVADALYHEVGYAFVQLKNNQKISPDELKNHCRQLLANYKIPKHIEFIANFPQLPNGKINRKRLASQAAAKVTAL